MVVVISAASVNKVNLPWFQHNVQQGHVLVPNVQVSRYSNSVFDLVLLQDSQGLKIVKNNESHNLMNYWLNIGHSESIVFSFICI